MADLVKRQGHVLPNYMSQLPPGLVANNQTGELGSVCSGSASMQRVALVIDEWIPLQRLLSDETTMNSLHFAGISGSVGIFL